MSTLSTEHPEQREYVPVWSLLLRLPIAIVLMGVALFLPAGTLRWPMGWAMLGVFTALMVAAVLAVPVERELAGERTSIKQGAKPWDTWIATIASVMLPYGMFVLGGLDHRFGWSPELPLTLQVLGAVLIVPGYALMLWAAAVNRFYSRYVRIQTERGHHVVTDGPYRVVRHPSYVGSIPVVLGMALGLGSLWGLALAAALIGMLILRTALEDRALHDELPGYEEYARETRYRLIPGIW